MSVAPEVAGSPFAETSREGQGRRLPDVRTEGILSRPVADELVLLDARRHRAFCLGPAARSVWEACAAGRTRDQAVRAVAEALGLPPDGDGLQETVRLALDRLSRAGLLAEDASERPLASLPTRRDVARRLGLAAAGLPLLSAIATPTAAQTASCLADVGTGQTCLPSQCGVECGGPTLCGTATRQCRRVGAVYRCLPPTAGTCP